MGFLGWIQASSREVSDATAGTDAYFELATTNLSLRRALGRAFAEEARGRLLDAGAGRQAYRSLLEARAASYESLDLDPMAGITHHVGDLQAMPLPDASYDTVVCTQTLHHVPDAGAALAEMARVLRPGGRLILSAPHLAWLHNEPHDYLRFTEHGLRRLLARAGLEPVRVEPVGGLLCFLAYAPSTVLLAAVWRVRPLFRAALALNSAAIRLVLWLDRVIGVPRLYPANYVVVARKP